MDISLPHNQVDEATKLSVEVRYQQLSQHDPIENETIDRPVFQSELSGV